MTDNPRLRTQALHEAAVDAAIAKVAARGASRRRTLSLKLLSHPPVLLYGESRVKYTGWGAQSWRRRAPPAARATE